MTLAILETAIYMIDLDAAEAFYGGLLDMERIVRAGNRHVFYRCESSVLLIFNPDETEKPGDMPGHGARGRGHLCFAASLEEQAAWEKKLNAAGYETVTKIEWPNGARSIYFSDPAGNSLEFAEPNLWDF